MSDQEATTINKPFITIEIHDYMCHITGNEYTVFDFPLDRKNRILSVKNIRNNDVLAQYVIPDLKPGDDYIIYHNCLFDLKIIRRYWNSGMMGP